MIEIYYDSVNYTDFLYHFGKIIKAKPSEGMLTIPSNFGEGYLKALTLPKGISVLISDCKFREDLMMHRTSVKDQSFILQFNEAVETPTGHNHVSLDAFNMMKQMVLLTNTQITTKYFVPANCRMVSFRIIFQRHHLSEILQDVVVDEVLTKYFSEFVQFRAIDPLDVDYRLILNEVIKKDIDQPLAINFIQNRTMLLIEKFLTKYMMYQKPVHEKVKFSDSEIVRLMKIESMLVNDFSITPPNINDLSKISAMSPTKLKNDFKRLYGMPIYEYYQKNRMQRAKSLLLEGNLSIKEVGIKVGYTNLSHFAGSFKKEFGFLPSQLVAKDVLA